jgi:hypothetical protein
MGQCCMASFSFSPITEVQVLFHPSDIGLAQSGVAEAVIQAVQGTHPSLHSLLYNNVILSGRAHNPATRHSALLAMAWCSSSGGLDWADVQSLCMMLGCCVQVV